MAVLVVLLALLSALISGVVALFTVGEIPAALVVIVSLGLGGYGAVAAAGGLRGAIAGVLAVAVIGAGAFGGYQAFTIYSALSDNDGAVDAPDPVALASAEAKIDAAGEQAGFRIELTAAELTAVMQEELTEESDHPIRSVTLTVVDGNGDDNGSVEFEVRFKSGSLTGSGAVSAELRAGAIAVEVIDADLGGISVPGIARGALEDIIETVADLNERLAEQRADVQLVEVGDGRVLIVGVQAGGELVTLGDVLDGVRANIAGLGAALEAPAETLGPGRVNATQEPGASYYVALGDSLAANVGVAAPRDGYVARLHAALEARSGALGLRNFGISGETSGTLIRAGQLDDALAFMRDQDIAYVTIDIGANDLLGHIYSDDCGETLDTPACQDRLESTLERYESNLDRILSEIEDSAGDATIAFLGTYNPFSMGFGSAVALEAQTDEITQRLNAIAERIATAHDAVYADGFAPLRGRAGATTHMLDARPDIHPNEIGYDVLAAALADAIP